MKSKKYIKRTTLAALFTLLVLSLLAGCASSVSDKQATAPALGADFGTVSLEGGYQQKSLVSVEEEALNQTNTGTGLSGEISRKIIKNASIGLRSTDVLATYEDVLTIVEGAGGYESGRNERRSDDHLYLQATLRVPADRLDQVLEVIRERAQVEYARIKSEDITDQYYDTSTRLQTMEQTLEQYYDYLRKAKTIEESLNVQYRIDDVTAELESLKGRLSRFDSLLTESTIELEILEETDPTLVRHDVDLKSLSWDDLTYLLRRGFQNGLDSFVLFFQNALIFIVSHLAGILVLILLLVLLGLYLKRRKRRKRERALLQPETARKGRKSARKDKESPVLPEAPEKEEEQ